VKVKRTTWIAGAAFAALAAGLVPVAQHGGLLAPPVAFAQNLGQRTVSGDVIDDTSSPVPGATVFLKNLKTKAIRSYTSSKAGRFYFAQVNMTDDFDLWAEKSGKKSDVKTVSSWDARKDFVVELKMK
jgi:Carboxypeptidase regulatory-like domain